MAYVTKLINNVNIQVAENVEPRLLDFNLESLKKAMTRFTSFNDEYSFNLDGSEQFERAFKTLLSIEDNFQQCIANAESYLADCQSENSPTRSSRKSSRYSISSCSTRNEKMKPQARTQDFQKRERENLASEFSEETERGKKIAYSNSATLENDTSTNQEIQDFKTPTHTARAPYNPKPLTLATLQTSLFPGHHILSTSQPHPFFPYHPNMMFSETPTPNPQCLYPSIPHQDFRAEIQRREGEPQMEKNMPIKLPLSRTR